jgi:hypothetical protein
MGWLLLVMGSIVAGGVAAGIFWRPLRSFGLEVQLGRARELFALQRERLQGQFFAAASATGKPRGLRWQRCDFDGSFELARDRHTGQIIALLPVTIQFEAVEGSDMEGLAAVGNLRNASAVFFFDRGQWHTVGKTVFNMNPDEALAHFKNQYERIVEDRERETPR